MKRKFTNRKITNRQLARGAGISEQQISNILNGVSGCTERTASKLSDAAKELGVIIPPAYWTYQRNDARRLMRDGNK